MKSAPLSQQQQLRPTETRPIIQHHGSSDSSVNSLSSIATTHSTAASSFSSSSTSERSDGGYKSGMPNHLSSITNNTTQTSPEDSTDSEGSGSSSTRLSSAPSSLLGFNPHSHLQSDEIKSTSAASSRSASFGSVSSNGKERERELCALREGITEHSFLPLTSSPSATSPVVRGATSLPTLKMGGLRYATNESSPLSGNSPLSSPWSFDTADARQQIFPLGVGSKLTSPEPSPPCTSSTAPRRNSAFASISVPSSNLGTASPSPPLPSTTEMARQTSHSFSSTSSYGGGGENPSSSSDRRLSTTETFSSVGSGSRRPWVRDSDASSMCSSSGSVLAAGQYWVNDDGGHGGGSAVFDHDEEDVQVLKVGADGIEFLDPRPEPPGAKLSIDRDYEDKVVLTVTLPGFSLDNITVAMKRGHKIHIVADAYGENGGHFEKLVCLGAGVSSAAPRAEFDGTELKVHVQKKVPSAAIMKNVAPLLPPLSSHTTTSVSLPPSHALLASSTPLDDDLSLTASSSPRRGSSSSRIALTSNDHVTSVAGSLVMMSPRSRSVTVCDDLNRLDVNEDVDQPLYGVVGDNEMMESPIITRRCLPVPGTDVRRHSRALTGPEGAKAAAKAAREEAALRAKEQAKTLPKLGKKMHFCSSVRKTISSDGLTPSSTNSNQINRKQMGQQGRSVNVDNGDESDESKINSRFSGGTMTLPPRAGTFKAFIADRDSRSSTPTQGSSATSSSSASSSTSFSSVSSEQCPTNKLMTTMFSSSGGALSSFPVETSPSPTRPKLRGTKSNHTLRANGLGTFLEAAGVKTASTLSTSTTPPSHSHSFQTDEVDNFASASGDEKSSGENDVVTPKVERTAMQFSSTANLPASAVVP